MKKRSAVPYASATSGMKARDEIMRMLQRFGCDSVGFMDEFKDCSVLLAFHHRGRPVQLRASAKGWAAMYLKDRPWSGRMKTGRVSYEQAAQRQGLVAINSVLRDWVKGQITAVECGMLSFDAVFAVHMLSGDGRPLMEFLKGHDLLPAPSEGNRQ